MICSRIVSCHEGPEALHAWVTIPLRIRDVHLKTGAENAFGVVEAGGFQHRSDRNRYIRYDMAGVPIELSDLLDPLSRKFRRSGIEENIRIAGSCPLHLPIPTWA